MSLGTFRRRQVRRRWVLGCTLPALAAGILLIVASAGSFPSGLSPLPGSSFDTSNGSLSSSSSYHDWNPDATGHPDGLGPIDPIDCVNRVNCGTDLIKNNDDDALGQGSKEDDENPTDVTGSIPPNKDDLRRFYINKEQSTVTNCGGTGVSKCDYLYVAWERSNVLGSAHMDFEFNKLFCDPSAANLSPPQATNCSANGVTPLRSADDRLIAFDFGGTGAPVLTEYFWIVSGVNDGGKTPAQACTASSSFPCWGNATDLGAGTAEAQASVNGADVVDKNAPDNPFTLGGSTTIDNKGNVKGVDSRFGEAGINLTRANFFPAGQCKSLGSAYLKSRSSGSSFTSELKDFIKPIPIHISNCGEIKIIKQTNPRGVDQKFSFTSNLPAIPNSSSQGGVACATGGSAGVDASGNFCLNDHNNSGKTLGSSAAAQNDHDNTIDGVNIPSGSYTVTEAAPGTGFAYDSATCTGGTTSVNNTTRAVSITLAANDVVVCVFQNNQQLGAIKLIKKSSKTAATTLAGAHFRVCTNGTDGGERRTPCTAAKSGSDDLGPTGTDGIECIDGLAFGDYYVSEKTAPTGYALDDGKVHKVTVNTNSSCPSTNIPSTQTLTFLDTPLTDLLVTVTSEASGGTKSAVSCVKFGTTTAIGNSPQPAGAVIGTISTYADPVELRADPTHGAALAPGKYTCTIDIDP